MNERNRYSATAHSLRESIRGVRLLLVVLLGAAGLLVVPALNGTTSAAPFGVGVNNPPLAPHSIIVFPQRDFISADGYVDGDLVVVHVIQPDGTVISTDEANPIAPQGGIVEVNHPGGACWFGQTPDIRPGDNVQIDIVAGPRAGTSDATTVRNITAKRPVADPLDPNTVLVHGTAQDGFTAIPGNPLPINEIEQRIVAPGSLFAANGRRTMRANALGGVDGTLTYDAVDPITNPAGINWTAKYSGLSTADVTLALGAESRGMWLGLAIPPAIETTVYEIGALTVGGPAAPCTAPLQVRPPPAGSELVPPTDPTNLAGAFDGVNNVTLTWDASSDNVGVTAYGIYRNGEAIFTVSNRDGSAPAPTTFVESNLPPGDYTFTVRAFDEVGNGSGLSNQVGPFSAVQRVDVNNFPINDPPLLPINIIVFPSRDFISPSGFLDSDVVSVQVLRENASGLLVVVSSADGILPIDGFAEVNHPGGACFQGVTPDIRVGDVVRTIAYNPANITAPNPDGIRSIDQTTVSGVTAFRPVIVQPASAGGNDGIVEIHGTALGANGLPLPIDQIEQRMIATHGVGLWDFNGRRAMRAAANSDGTLNYDTVNNPMGVNWTARYSGLDEADVARMADADTRAHWLGRTPLLFNEATIFENSPGTNPPGPAGPACTRPLEVADVVPPSAPADLTAVQSSASQVSLAWTGSTDDWSVAGYRIYVDGIAVANTDALARSYLRTAAPGLHTYAVAAFDHASPRGPGANIIAQISSGLGNLYGNLSLFSNTVSLLQADVTAPSVPSNLVAQSGEGLVTLIWSASADDVGVTEYGVYRSGGLIATVTNVQGNGTVFTDSPLDLGTYTYTVDAADAAGNRSAQSAAATATVTSVPDVTPPSIPTGVGATTSPDVHGRDVVVTWTSSTDEVGGSGVGGYDIYRKRVLSPDTDPEVLVASVNQATLSYTDANLGSATYAYTVVAFDSAGNHSLHSISSPNAIVANDPPIAPHSVIAFPARDFISATGFTPGASYSFTLIRGGQTYQSAPFPADATGTVEVNHPGGTCWIANTPDIRPGDVVRITDDATGVADQTTVANVTADRPIAINANTVVVHGTATDANGQPIPAAQVENRLIVGTVSSFDVNGRRLLRTGNDGTLAYDAPGSTHWTATYTGLTANDVLRAVGGTSPNGTVFVGAESRAHWLGRAPLALVEATIFENGPGVIGGPSAPCAAPAETPVAAASFFPASASFSGIQFLPAPAVTSGAKCDIQQRWRCGDDDHQHLHRRPEHGRLRPLRWHLPERVPQQLGRLLELHGVGHLQADCSRESSGQPEPYRQRCQHDRSDCPAHRYRYRSHRSVDHRLADEQELRHRQRWRFGQPDLHRDRLGHGSHRHPVDDLVDLDHRNECGRLHCHCSDLHRCRAGTGSAIAGIWRHLHRHRAVQAGRTDGSFGDTAAQPQRGRRDSCNQYDHRADRCRRERFGVELQFQPGEPRHRESQHRQGSIDLGQEQRKRCGDVEPGQFHGHRRRLHRQVDDMCDPRRERLVQRRRSLHCAEHGRFVPGHPVGDGGQRTADEGVHGAGGYYQVVNVSLYDGRTRPRSTAEFSLAD